MVVRCIVGGQYLLRCYMFLYLGFGNKSMLIRTFNFRSTKRHKGSCKVEMIAELELPSKAFRLPDADKAQGFSSQLCDV